MSEDENAMRRLRAANPVPPERAPRADSPKARALLERIVATPVTPVERPRRRVPRRVKLVLVPVVIVALAAAGYGIYRVVASDPLVVACYRQMAAVSDVHAADASERDAVATCRELWEPGGEFNRDGSLPVPPLTACVKEGTVAVYPHPTGIDPCEALGLRHAAQTTLEGEARALSHVRDDLAEVFTASCVPQDRAVAVARAELRRWGLDRWRVLVPTPFSASLPCGGAAYDAASRTLIISPVETIP